MARKHRVPKCPQCKSSQVYRYVKTKRWRCGRCGEQFTLLGFYESPREKEVDSGKKAR